MRNLKTAYDAWWFLYYHPKFCLPARVEVRDAEHAKTFKDKHSPIDGKTKIFWRIKPDKGGNLWAYSRLINHAVESNLSIHYSKVDKQGTVSDIARENKYRACWLEFGREEYGYSEEWQWKDDKQRSGLINYHDPDIDAIGATFDEALINLAHNVLRKYGDYKRKRQ